jgi:hypothetical protein
MAPLQQEQKPSFQVVNLDRTEVVNLDRTGVVNLDRSRVVSLNRTGVVNYTGFSTSIPKTVFKNSMDSFSCSSNEK